MEMDDRLVIRICLIGSVLSMIVLYFAALSLGSESVNVGDISGNLAGRVVNVSGYASEVYLHKNGHVFFNLREGQDKVRVVVWESDVERLAYSGVNLTEIKNGDRIQIVGTVEIYQGEPEIIPLRAQVKVV
ncbi:MAG TPA: exodeoxyribonuclease VII large subunit [archaeon]|nr:exodeoxyribonuclease VII large subunit [archaeon]